MFAINNGSGTEAAGDDGEGGDARRASDAVLQRDPRGEAVGAGCGGRGWPRDIRGAHHAGPPGTTRR